VSSSPDQLQRIYSRRFDAEQEHRDRVWRILIDDFFKKYVPQKGAVLDLGCGYGHFINQVECSKRLAMDLNPNASNFIQPGVVLLQQDCSEPWNLPASSLDLVFTSNFFEHLPTKELLSRTLAQAYACLVPGGKLVAMGPNVKVVPGSYWDFFDHHLALTELSLSEALELEGFKVAECVPRFLPYTMAGKRPQHSFLIRLYLKLPMAWRWFGQQFLIVAEKPLDTSAIPSNDV
jgi:SAM-dependent methyltransferase